MSAFTRVFFHQEELTAIARSQGMEKTLGKEALQVKRTAQASARRRTGKMARQIHYHTNTDAYSAYADIGSDAKNKGFRYGAYWNAIDHYLDDAVR